MCLWATDIRGLKESEGTFTEHETGKDLPTRGSTGCAGSLPLGEVVLEVQGPFLCGQVGSAVHEPAFTNNNQIHLETLAYKLQKS